MLSSFAYLQPLLILRPDPTLGIPKRKMWYLLVAAGAGYLAQRWQNTHKSRHILLGQGQNQISSPPTSAPGTPRGGTFSSSRFNESDDEHNEEETSSNSAVGKASIVGNCDAPLPCYVSGHADSSYRQVGTLPLDAPQDSCPPLVVKSNKRSACEAFLVPVSDPLEPIQGSRPGSELFNTSKTTEAHTFFTSETGPEFSNGQGITKVQGVFTSKPNLGFAEQVQGDSTSPSSCCSSSSTVLNSPVGRKPLGQIHGSFQSQDREHRQGVIIHEQLSKLDTHVADSPSLLEIYAFKGRGQGAALSGSKYHGSDMPNTSLLTDDDAIQDASTQRPFVFTGENQRGITRTELFNNGSASNNKVMKQGFLLVASAESSPRKIRSYSSPSHSGAAGSSCDPEGESLVSFALAMAVLCMVSSGKREMDKMGQVLKETEDLVSDMRKELEERRAQSPQNLSDRASDENFLTIKSKNAGTEVVAIDKTDLPPLNSLCQVGSSDDESVRSAITEEHTQCTLRMCDLKGPHEDTQGHPSNGDSKDGCDSEAESDSSTLEETGDDDCSLSMLELERKLWKIFQQRQEEKIKELEEALEMALNKLRVKEDELQWWKNRAAWLMGHSFGSPTGPISGKDEAERVEGLSHVDKLRFPIDACDFQVAISHKYSADDNNSAGDKIARDRLSSEGSSLTLEEGCIEFVVNEDGCKKISRHQNHMVRSGSSCSFGSDDSVLSFDVGTFT